GQGRTTLSAPAPSGLSSGTRSAYPIASIAVAHGRTCSASPRPGAPRRTGRVGVARVPRWTSTDSAAAVGAYRTAFSPAGCQCVRSWTGAANSSSAIIFERYVHPCGGRRVLVGTHRDGPFCCDGWVMPPSCFVCDRDGGDLPDNADLWTYFALVQFALDRA